MVQATELSQIIAANPGYVILFLLVLFSIFYLGREAVVFFRTHPRVLHRRVVTPVTAIPSQDSVRSARSRVVSVEIRPPDPDPEYTEEARRERLRKSLDAEDMSKFGCKGRRLDGAAADDSMESLRVRVLANSGFTS